jgi:antitoxin component YwqK of YwqJK toxin-antitoxin module
MFQVPMKTVFLVVGILFCSSSAFAGGYEKYFNGKKHDDRYSEPKNFTGTVTIKRDGKLEEKYSMRNGKKHGPFVEYDSQGRIEDKGAYADDKMHGKWMSYGKSSAYPGKLSSIKNYVMGKTQGVQEEYEDGKLERRYYVKPNGSMDTDIYFHPKNGKLKSLNCGEFSVMKSDRQWCGLAGKPSKVKIYNEDGSLRKIEGYYKGEMHGRIKSYSKGKVYKYETYENGKSLKGPALGESKNGGKWIVKCAKSNKKKCKEIAYFKDLPKQKEIVIQWDGQDKVSETEYFQNGKTKYKIDVKGSSGKVYAKHYYDNGKLEREGYYSNRSGYYWGHYYRRMVPNGLIKSYTREGKLYSEENYVEGKEQGLHKRYCYNSKKVCSKSEYENGRLKSQRNYDQNGKLVKAEEYFPDGSKKSLSH